MDHPAATNQLTFEEQIPDALALDEARIKRKIVWLASYPKSGNTWVRIFIHNLSRQVSGEGHQSQDINAINMLTVGDSTANRFASRLGKPIHEATRAEIAALRCLVQADLADTRDGPIYTKTHNAVAQIDGHQTINFAITLGAVYIVRNPLDVAISYSHHAGMSIDSIITIMNNATAGSAGSDKSVFDFMGSWSFHVATWMSIPHRPVLVIRYEDMLTNPRRTFARLASFLRFGPTAEQLDRAIDESSFAKLARQEELNGFIERSIKAEKFFRAGKAEQWKEILSKNQIKSIIDSHASMMMRCGYLSERCF